MDAELKRKLERLSTCDITDALVKLRLAGEIQSDGLIPDLNMYSPPGNDVGPERLVGPAFTALMVLATDQAAPRTDEHFVDACPRDHIIMIQMPRGCKAATWGGLMTIGAQARGVIGAVIDGGCRDLAEHRELGFPVFARQHSTLGRGSFIRTSQLNVPLTIPSEESASGARGPDTIINPGDILVCDEDGCVAIPVDMAERVAEMAQKGKAIDEKIALALADGMGVAEAMKKYRT